MKLFGDLNPARRPEVRKRMSKSHKKLYKNGYIAPMKGKHHTVNTKIKMSKAKHRLYANGYVNNRKGKKLSNKIRIHMSQAQKALYADGYVHPMKGQHQSKKLIALWSKIKKGKKQSKKSKSKESKTWKRKYANGYINPMKGKSMSIVARNKISVKLRGEKSYLWQGGKSFEPYGLEFNKNIKKQIKIRDGYRCQQCFKHESELFTKKGKLRKLTIHHINYNKKDNNPSNLISLCLNCHSQTNFNRKDWTKYFKSKLL